MLANEGGASTLAFIIAYALVLEPGGWRARFASLAPAAAVVLGWRAVYVASGFGVRNFIGYIDPGYEPFLFLSNLPFRASALLGGQLTGLPPELAIVLSTKWKTILAVLLGGCSLVCAVVFLPMLRRQRVTRFWAVVMLLALVPAATVYPLSKNLRFVAVGAFGVIASFLAQFALPQGRAVRPRLLRAISWCVAAWLVLAHVPGALAARSALALASPLFSNLWAKSITLHGLPEIGGREVIMLNDATPCAATLDRMNHGQLLPKRLRLLVPGITPFVVSRPDVSTLILKAKGTDLFACPHLGPIHAGYAITTCFDLLCDGRTWKTGDRVTRTGFLAEVLEISPRGAPRAVAFHFDRPLESEDMVWLFLDWRRFTTSRFVPPQIGSAVEIAGPRGSRSRSVHRSQP